MSRRRRSPFILRLFAAPTVWYGSPVPMSPEEEENLIRRCADGDASAWDQFFDEHYGPIGRFLFQLIPEATPQDVEEICQDTFLAAIRSVKSFRHQSRAQTWLFRIATNKARDFRDRLLTAKRGGGKPAISLDSDDSWTGLKPEIRDLRKTPDQELLNHEAWSDVRRALDDLGDPCREILELRYFADLDYDSIARSLQLNAKTVSSRLSRCLDRLGALLHAARKAEQKPGAPV